MKENKIKTWKIKDKIESIAVTCKVLFIALIKGNFIQKSQIQRFFPHFIFLFIIAFAWLFISYTVESKLISIEKTKVEIKNLQIECSQKKIILESLHKQTDIIEKLKAKNSKIGYPTHPHYVIKD